MYKRLAPPGGACHVKREQRKGSWGAGRRLVECRSHPEGVSKDGKEFVRMLFGAEHCSCGEELVQGLWVELAWWA